MRHRLKRMFALNRAKLAVTIISIRIAGDWAFDWGWHSLTLTPRKGGRAEEGAYSLFGNLGERGGRQVADRDFSGQYRSAAANASP